MRLLPHATLGWHMEFMKSIYPEWDGGYAATLVKRFNLRLEQNARSLSLGEHVKAALLLALARRPRLLILDEPTTGLDPVARHEVISEFMDVLRDDSRSILFSSHNTVDVERISDRITFIDRGRDRRQRQQGGLPRSLAPHPGAAAAGRDAPRTAEHRGAATDGHFVTLTTNQFSEGLRG